MTTSQLRHSISWSPWRLAFFLISLLLTGFALSPMTRAQLPSPTPDGGYPGENTAEGDGALFSLTIGTNNTAIGFDALYGNTSGRFNTAIGWGALSRNTTGLVNTAIGFGALLNNVTGYNNTANGNGALHNNTGGIHNTADGAGALYTNTTGVYNTANGVDALFCNTTSSRNTALGFGALFSNTTGGSNIALGYQAGQNLTTGDNNIDIGNTGIAAEANTIRIGTQGTQTKTFIGGISGTALGNGLAVRVNANGQLGTVGSSARFKQNIMPMDKASEAILALKPVTFHYKKELDPEGIPQFGLVAEDVEKVSPDLVARDADGKIYTVRYEAVNAMLLNEFLKEHRAFLKEQRKVGQQEATITHLKSTVAQQENEIVLLAAHLKEQDSKIEKVSAQLKSRTPPPRIVLNNQ